MEFNFCFLFASSLLQLIFSPLPRRFTNLLSESSTASRPLQYGTPYIFCRIGLIEMKRVQSQFRTPSEECRTLLSSTKADKGFIYSELLLSGSRNRNFIFPISPQPSLSLLHTAHGSSRVQAGVVLFVRIFDNQSRYCLLLSNCIKI